MCLLCLFICLYASSFVKRKFCLSPDECWEVCYRMRAIPENRGKSFEISDCDFHLLLRLLKPYLAVLYSFNCSQCNVNPLGRISYSASCEMSPHESQNIGRPLLIPIQKFCDHFQECIFKYFN